MHIGVYVSRVYSLSLSHSPTHNYEHQASGEREVFYPGSIESEGNTPPGHNALLYLQVGRCILCVQSQRHGGKYQGLLIYPFMEPWGWVIKGARLCQ